MAKYTIQLKTIIDNLTFGKANNYREAIEMAIPLIFDFNYHFYGTQEEKNRLEKKILYHFYLKEIGQETVELFKFNLEMRLNEIMPVYSKMYEALKDIDVLSPNWQTETFEKTSNVESTNDISSVSNNENINVDLPQTSNEISDKYANTKDSSLSNSKSNAINSGKNNENYKKINKGNNGVKTNVELIKEYEQAKLDIELMILNDLGSLFMLVY